MWCRLKDPTWVFNMGSWTHDLQIMVQGRKCSVWWIQRGYFETFKEPRNQFQGIDSASLCSLAARHDNPLLTRFLAPIDCSKIPAHGFIVVLKVLCFQNAEASEPEMFRMVTSETCSPRCSVWCPQSPKEVSDGVTLVLMFCTVYLGTHLVSDVPPRAQYFSTFAPRPKMLSIWASWPSLLCMVAPGPTWVIIV